MCVFVCACMDCVFTLQPVKCFIMPRLHTWMCLIRVILLSGGMCSEKLLHFVSLQQFSINIMTLYIAHHAQPVLFVQMLSGQMSL